MPHHPRSSNPVLKPKNGNDRSALTPGSPPILTRGHSSTGYAHRPGKNADAPALAAPCELQSVIARLCETEGRRQRLKPSKLKRGTAIPSVSMGMSSRGSCADVRATCLELAVRHGDGPLLARKVSSPVSRIISSNEYGWRVVRLVSELAYRNVSNAALASTSLSYW